MSDYQSIRISPLGTPTESAFTALIVTRETCPPGSKYVNPPLAMLTLFLTEQGEATIEAGEQTLYHRPGSLVMVNAGLPLLERVGASASWKVSYLMLSGAWADAMGNILEERGKGCLMYQPASLPWQRQFHELCELGVEQERGWEWSFLSGCAALFGWIARYPPSTDGTETLVDRVERLLAADIGRAWNVEELAGALGMTARQFGYRFSKEVGIAPALWLRERRVIAARRLLREGRAVSETADILGFANPYHFSRLFKSVTGLAPSLLRKSPHSPLHKLPVLEAQETDSKATDETVPPVQPDIVEGTAE